MADTNRLVTPGELAKRAGITRQAVDGYAKRHWDFPTATYRGRRMYPLKRALAFIRRCRAEQRRKVESGMFGANAFWHEEGM